MWGFRACLVHTPRGASSLLLSYRKLVCALWDSSANWLSGLGCMFSFRTALLLQTKTFFWKIVTLSQLEQRQPKQLCNYLVSGTFICVFAYFSSLLEIPVREQLSRITVHFLFFLIKILPLSSIFERFCTDWWQSSKG